MSEIIHKTEPTEHWIVDGKAYRLATEADIGKETFHSDVGLKQALDAIPQCLTNIVRTNTLPFYFGGWKWRYAYIQDDSLVQRNVVADLVEFEVMRTPVPALGEDWYLLTAEDGVFKKGDKANASLTDESGWVNCDCIQGKSIKEWIEGNCRAARYFGQPTVEHVVDCVTVEQRIAERILDDKAMKQAEATVSKPIDWTKPVRTKDGRAVRVLCTDGPGKYPVIGIIEGDTRTRTWQVDGIYWPDTCLDSDEYNLENVPSRIQREYWVNVYEGVETLLWYHTKKDADYHATGGRLACVKITIDCEEGEGL